MKTRNSASVTVISPGGAKPFLSPDRMKELRSLRDAASVIGADLRVRQAEFNLAAAKLERRWCELMAELGVAPTSSYNEETGEITPRVAGPVLPPQVAKG